MDGCGDGGQCLPRALGEVDGVGVPVTKSILYTRPGCEVSSYITQSINQSNPQSATRAQEKPHPSATTRAANPATRSVAGLGG